eukprot:337157-Amphidinium_carterae.1
MTPRQGASPFREAAQVRPSQERNQGDSSRDVGQFALTCPIFEPTFNLALGSGGGPFLCLSPVWQRQLKDAVVPSLQPNSASKDLQ